MLKHNFIVIIVGVICLQIPSSFALWMCTVDADCSNLEGGVCSNGECVCPLGTQNIDNGRRCVEPSPYHFSSCYEDFQCTRLFTGFECHRNVSSAEPGTCRCLSGYHYTRGRCWLTSDYGDSCARDEECQSPVLRNPFALQCHEGTCTCADGFYLRQRAECRRSGLAVGDACVLDVDCQFDRGVCDVTAFTCQLGSGRSNAPIAVDEHTKYSTNIAKMDYRKTLRSEASNTITTRQHGVSCVTNTDCEDHLVCSSLNVCHCPTGYYYKDGICMAEIGSPASDESTCEGFFVMIEDGICKCLPNFYADENMRECVKATISFTDSCQNDENCHTFGAAAVCGERSLPWGFRFCECIPELSIREDHNSMCRLFSAIGEVCQVDSDCMAGVVEILCVDDAEGQGRCACPDHLTPVGNLCLASGLDIGDTCQVSEECTAVENLACDEGSCACADGYLEVDGICFPMIGGSCTGDDDCVITNSVCVDVNNATICQCIDNYVAHLAECIPAADGYMAPCAADVQCEATLGDGGVCSEEQCSCSVSYHYRDERCWPITHLYEACSTVSQCYLGDLSERVVCRNSQCECDFDFPYSETTHTCSSATTIGPYIVLFALIMKFSIN